MGNSGRYCDNVSRRSFLQLGVAGMASVAMPSILRAKEASAKSLGQSKKTSVILLWLDGGPGHMDMYDMKPDAPKEYAGIWKPIRSRVPGFDVTELYPKQAKITNLFSMVRSLHHDTGDHFAGGHRMLTTKDMGVSGVNNEGKFPGIGAIVNRECGARREGVPGYVGVPYAMSIGLRPGYFGAHMLGHQLNPFETIADANMPKFQVQNLNLAQGLTLDRLQDRRSLLKHFDTVQKGIEKHPSAPAMERFTEEAYQFVVGPTAKQAFDINKEDPKLRDAYGRHSWGQSTILARRLVEAGSTFVTVNFAGWDHHWDLEKSYQNYLPKIDELVSALFLDLQDRGMLETTLVVLCGEFGRTPKMNDGGNGGAPRSMGTPGRDHWGNAMFCLMGGGGVKGGIIVGSTDAKGER
ncbi:MAG: DUF1501 domain-containing protein, partial [Planctomycetes bacterium]|nr:DUF1501 domain-containing protein [Planctomycetota bacterium]